MLDTETKGHPAKYRTTRRCGYLPAGMTVEAVTISLAGGLSPDNRDYGAGGDGQWLIIKYPNGIFYGQVRTVEDLEKVNIHLEDLEEI